MVSGQSGDPNLIQIDFHHFKLLEHFIMFSKSTRSSKSKFGAKSYAKIRKGAAANLGTLHGVAVHCPRGGGATALGFLLHTRKGGATPRKGCALATSSVAFSDPRTTETCSFLLLFFSKLIQIDSNNSSFPNVLTPPSVHHLVHVC